MMGEPNAHLEPIAVVGIEGSKLAEDRESRRQVVVDVLATAIVDLLLEERTRVRGKHEAGTC